MDIKIILGLLIFLFLDTAIAATRKKMQLEINKCLVGSRLELNGPILPISDRGYDADCDEAIEDVVWDKIILNDRISHIKELQPGNQYYAPEQCISQLVLMLLLLIIAAGSLRWMF